MPQSPWGQTELAAGDCRCWRIGPLGFWVRRAEREWQVAHQRFGEEALAAAAAGPAPPPELSWTRWASGTVNPPVRVRPMTPDRPVVVRPAQPFRILKGGIARIYIRIPVWARIELAVEDDPLQLTDIPTVELSNTWFGSLFEGQLCYWTETAARRSIEGFEPRPHLAVAPMFIHNQFQAELPLEKICLHTEGLSLYAGERGLWTSEVRVTNTGPGAPERIEVAAGPPEEAAGAEPVAEPRRRRASGFLARSVDLLQSLPGVGGQGVAG